MSNILDGLAGTIVTTIEAMTVSFTANGTPTTSTVNGFVWAPTDLDGPGPWAVVELPDIARTPIDTPESQIGSTDWFASFPVIFYFQLAEPAYSQAQAVNTIEAFIKAIDANPSLGSGTVLDAKVTSTGPPLIEGDQQNAVIVYPTTLEVFKLV